MTSCTVDWQATAAWAQAGLTALAVFLTAYLQDRSFSKREAAQLTRRRESVAFGARWLWSTMQQLQAKLVDGMDPEAYRLAYNDSNWLPASHAARSVPALELQDEEMAAALMRLHLEIGRTETVMQHMLHTASPTALDAKTELQRASVPLFNVLAALERRSAELAQRKARL